MNYTLVPTEFFLIQINELSNEAKSIIEKRLELVKINPFRNKKIEGYKLFLFRIRFEDNKKEKRIIYLADKPKVYVLCILDRDKEYKDLKKYLKSLGY